MPTHYRGRLTLILFVLLAALWAIFPSGNPKRPDLKPGIDMVGGTSLLYEIKAPEGGIHSDDLATQVAGSLKKRVDPDGVRNLIWRPQGATRLEIQMPLTATSGESAARRATFAEAQRALESTNVRMGAVIDAVERRTGDERRKRLDELAMGSETRERLLGGMASVFDQIQAARQKQDAATQAQKEIEYEKLKEQVEATNLRAAELEGILALKPETRDKRLAELRERFAKFPKRLEALDGFVKAFDQYAAVRGTLDDASDLKRLLQGSGILEFYILVNPGEMSADQLTTLYQRLERENGRPAAGDQARWFEIDKDSGKLGGIQREHNEKTWVLAWTTPDKSMVKREGEAPWGLEQAYPMRDQFGTPMVGFKFDAQGGANFGNLTTANVGRQLAIMLDDKVISAPNINEPIRGGSGQISGSFTAAELKYLISTLSAGSLPARLADQPISERTVGPQLGEDNLRAGLMACMFGIVVVAFFLIGYYYLAGVVAMFAVLMNMVLILGVMAMLNATFTLPSVAGIVLTIGMAVDANVLIFERLREEQQRGLSLRMALRNAYDRAFSAILDGNVTTGITSLCLYWFGSEEVKGFGLTLLIGIVSSLFTALFVTRTIFGLLIDKFNVQRLGSLPLSIPRWDEMLRPNIDWVSKAKYFYAFSLVFITIGLVAFGTKLAQGQMLDIEFASGTSVQFELKQPMKIEEVRGLITRVSEERPNDLPSPSVVSVGTDDVTYEVVTPSRNTNGVKDAIMAALGERLKLELASTFNGVGQPLDAVMGTHVFPIKSATDTFGGMTAEAAANHVGGVAIVLDNLSLPISPADIEARLERHRLQPQPGESTMPYRDTDVVSEATDPKQPITKAVLLVSDPAYPFEKDEQKWRDELAGPIWRLANQSINADAQLSRVTNFDAQVAGETQREAIIALTLSIIGIMAYIWVRFGNLKYGTATVWALVHDTLFVLAAVGMAHYVANTFIGEALLIEPFRLNLTLTAAILTVMGYSMNDTVVVFDRIRENRGKFGHVSRSVINDSINQTLSRTLLTGGTTILTILVMYIFGGPGIHGFTFALLVGILVGTYSSIAIAAPILLIGTPPGETGDARREKDVRTAPAGQQLQRA